ncbi:uncharacterized protein LOC126161990 [Schistocerca cancellata]|uniref:uncharacterized protein LOC126161990 n=1 Tax=Schistocerca cancellata TaxID=274614 RepID=UPI0021196875|nr:uncharacterized protein LOC126161990 [Schistocerca cancellata]
MTTAALFAFLLAAAATAASAAPRGPERLITKLPSWFKTCSRNDPNLNECIRQMIMETVRKSKDGIPELGAPATEPFLVREMLLEYQQGDVEGKVLIKNSLAHGLSDVIVKDVRMNLNDGGKFRFEADVIFKRLLLEGEYKGQGKIITFPIDGKGVFNNSMTDVVGTFNVTGEYYQKAGRPFLKLTRFSFLPEVGTMKVYASNLFAGNDELNKAALAFANEFWPVLYKELLPYADEAWDKVMRNEGNKVLAAIPFDVLFPDK